MFRKIALAATALALSATVAQASPGWTSTGVNFREGAGTHYPVIAWLQRCAPVHVDYYEGSWARVRWQDQWGWVARSYLRASNAHCTGYTRGHTGAGTYAPPRY